MTDNFLDSEAEVGSEEDDDVVIDHAKLKKKLSRPIESDEEEDEEDDEILDEDKNFINDEEEISEHDDEEDEDDERESVEKRSRSDSEMDEDDLDLIQENLGIRMKKKRRVMMEGDDEEEDDMDERIAGDEEELEDDVERDEDDDDGGESFIVDDERRPNRACSGALQDAQEIFGVDFDFNYEDEPDVEAPAEEISIDQIYEPVELERGLLTEFDSEVKLEDRPERFLLRRGHPVTSADDEELDREASWIFRQGFCRRPISEQPSLVFNKGHSTIHKIKEALNFMRNQWLEVPFIAFYRKEYVEPELNINDLWRVWKFDERWCRLKEQRERIVAMLERTQKYQFENVMSDPDKHVSESFRPLEEADIEWASHAQTSEELRDVVLHHRLYYSGENGLDENNFKVSHSKSPYKLFKNLVGFSKRFGLIPQNFAENVRDNYKKYEPEQFHIVPETYALEFIDDKFPTVEAVINAAVTIAAEELASDPRVRAVIRHAYFERALIDVQATEKGLMVISEEHPCKPFLFIRNKRVNRLKGEDFLNLVAAEKEGLLKIRLWVNETLEEQLRPYCIREEFTTLVERWNSLRKRVLSVALSKFLYPHFQKELFANLLNESKDAVISSCRAIAFSHLRVAPLHPEFEEDGMKILSIAYDESGAIAVLVDSSGFVSDLKPVPKLFFGRKDMNGRNHCLKVIKELVEEKRPDIILIGAENRLALPVCRLLRETLSEFDTTVEIVESDVSRVYQFSKRAEAEFKEYPSLARRAISIARRAQDPLLEFSQLVNMDKDLLCLNFHPLQTQIDPDELYEELLIEFINRSNEVGVDLNRCIAQPHTANVLQFVCGLGPRKANYLLKTISKCGGHLENRTSLITLCRMGPKVFVNCAGFIRIDASRLPETTESYIEVLDGSRVHPEAYEWARKMAVDALEYDDGAGGNGEETGAAALEEILESPERLKDLDLDAFAAELARTGYGDKSVTLYDIRAELTHRYKDLRIPFRPPSPEQLFYMLTSESPQTLHIGSLVICRVVGLARRRPTPEELENANPQRDDQGVWRCPFCDCEDGFSELNEVWSHFDEGRCQGPSIGVRVKLENADISGFIPSRLLSDSADADPATRVKYGMGITARVVRIDFERLSVLLSSRTSDLRDEKGVYENRRDPCYDEEAEKRLREQIAKKANSNKPKFRSRVIVHPSFHNVTYNEAETLLETLDSGEAIVRPSGSQGENFLTLSFKVASGIVRHFLIREEDKPHSFCVGRRLIIDDEEFEDLDEILARFVSPLATYLRDVLQHKNYKATRVGDAFSEIEQILREEKRKAPLRIPYCFSLSKQYPGRIMLSYLPRHKVHHEYFSIRPTGFKFRGQEFRNLIELINWFKKNFKQASSRTPTQNSLTPSTSFSSSKPTSPAPAGSAPSSQADSANQPIIPPVSAPSLPSNVPIAAQPQNVTVPPIPPPFMFPFMPPPFQMYPPFPMSVPPITQNWSNPPVSSVPPNWPSLSYPQQPMQPRFIPAAPLQRPQ